MRDHIYNGVVKFLFMRDHIYYGMVKYLFLRDHIYDEMVKYLHDKTCNIKATLSTYVFNKEYMSYSVEKVYGKRIFKTRMNLML